MLRCAMCPGPDAFQARDSRGLMQHMARMHLGQVLNAEAIAQLRALGKEACRVCAAIRARTTPHCNGPCGCATATRPLQQGDAIPDRRRGSHTSPAASSSPQNGAPAASSGNGNAQQSPHSMRSDDETECDAIHLRHARVSANSQQAAKLLGRDDTLKRVPMCVAGRMSVAMTEALEGCMAGDDAWAFLARFRTRLLLARVPRGADTNEELKRRLRLWERGKFDELIEHVLGQRDEQSLADRSVRRDADDDEERRGRRARQQTAAGARSKAVKGLVGGVAPGSPAERQRWTATLIPRSEVEGGPCTQQSERDEARECAWGRGDVREARKEMKAAGKRPGSHAGIPVGKIAPWSAPGPTADRQEHFDDMMRGSTPGQRRRLNRALDDLTVRWVINALPVTCRWMLNTQALFLRKDREPVSKEFDDEEWIRWLLQDGGAEWAQDISEADVEHVGAEMEVDESAPEVPETPSATAPNVMDLDSGAAGSTELAGVEESHSPAVSSVRPIQMGEWLRRWLTRRHLLLNKGDTERVMGAMRQLGVGTPGGAEALAIFQQVLHELWAGGRLEMPLARIKIDEKNCFGRLEWPAVRKAARDAMPRHFAVTCWKHQAVSGVEQAGVDPMPKDRGAEQGDVDAPLECGMTMGMISSAARSELHSMQRRGELPWAATSAADVIIAEQEFGQRAARHDAWAATSPAERRSTDGTRALVPDPSHEVQAFGGVADFWYLDDGDILCHPLLVRAMLECHDRADGDCGGQRNRSKSEVLYYVDDATLERHAREWQLAAVRELADVSTAAEPGLTLGVATGRIAAVEEQLDRKAKVVRAMQERVAITHDVQTEHVLNRESLGVGRVNHILRVHGEQLFQSGTALEAFDKAVHEEMDRLFPGLSAEGHEQATLAPAYGGLGWRRASDIALPANLAALVMAGPKVRYMAEKAVHAGLLRAGQVEEHLAAKTRVAEETYMRGLDEREKLKATEFLRRAQRAAEEQWSRAMAGGGDASVGAPSADTAYGDVDAAEESGRSITEEQEANDASPRRLTVPHLQKELSKLHDCTRLRALEATLTRQCNWPQLERLKDLRHPEVSHKWIWHLDTRKGSVLPRCDYVVTVQKRLGARVHEGDMSCRLCGAPLDPQLEHSECCATAEATRGHYACVRALVRGLKLADPAVTTEPRGLTSTTSRPADILTNAAVPGRGAALDVCVASPNASAAAGDAAAAAFKRKLRRYRREIPQLAAAGILYRPLVWTADGRPHPAVTRTLAFAAELASTRGETSADARALLSRWRHEIQVALQQRRAAMTRAVLPRMSAADACLLTGYSATVPSSDRRTPPLDQGGAADEVDDPDGDEAESADDDIEAEEELRNDAVGSDEEM